jgi:murein DD-endopeptidase MepM/ murein hydrolase activator NlpD
LRKRLIIILAMVLALCMSTSVLANSIDDAKKELQSITGEIEETKEELSQVKDEKEAVRNQLNQIEQDLNSKEKELAVVESQLSQAQKELETVKSELKEAEDELDKTQKKLDSLKQELQKAIEECEEQEKLNAARLRAMYMNSTASYLELLLESKSFNDLLNRVEMIVQMVTYDQQVFDSLQMYRDEVEQRKQDCEEQEQRILEQKLSIEKKKSELEEKERQIQVKREKIARQKQEIHNAQKEKEALINQLSQEEARILKELDQKEKESKAIEKRIRELIRRAEEERRKAEEAKKAANRGGGNSGGGKVSSSGMIWPVPGYRYISSYYGYRIHPIYGYRRMHGGIDIAGAGISNKPAVAVADGVVIIAEYSSSFGNYVVIDHGGGIATLYAHGNSIPVSVGQSVKQGDSVLYIGSTGLSTGPHLHFEVHVNGQRTNPLNYVSP